MEEVLERYRAFANGHVGEKCCSTYTTYVRRFLERRGRLPKAEDEARARIEEFVDGVPLTVRGSCSSALHLLFEMELGRRYRPARRPGDYSLSEEAEAVLAQFAGWMNSHMSLCEETAAGTLSTVGQFLCYTFPEGAVDLEGIDEFAAIRFLAKDKAHVGPSTRKQLAVRIRRFAKYLESSGHVRAAGMAALPLNAPAWARAGVPKTLADEQVSAIKSAAGRQRDEPLRDVAIAACMANLGLRTCEVARLRVEDVDFARGAVTISLSKSKTSRILPLDSETGGALADYVTMGRPPIRGVLFVRRTGEPMGAPGVRRAMRRVAAHAGVHPFGCHMLRHTAACKMVNAGTPLKVIADVLGHESVETTTAYAKVDLARMALVSAEWPGDAHE